MFIKFTAKVYQLSTAMLKAVRSIYISIRDENKFWNSTKELLDPICASSSNDSIKVESKVGEAHSICTSIEWTDENESELQHLIDNAGDYPFITISDSKAMNLLIRKKA